ncbi:hypothetical protein HMPREF3190_00383 [Umbribacter vaginalis]|nr:hypothetical protein HMPREF3190_00383 [Coriobacteriales bacterium DNF00809]
MDETSFDLSKELERAIHILIDKIESGIASDAEVLILPKLLEIKLGFCGGALWIRDKEQT